MEIKYKRMTIFGLLSTLVYIIVPLILFNVLSGLQLISFDPTFKITLVLLGILSVLIAVVKNIFSKDNTKGNIIGIVSSVFSGIYTFYLFGGFSSRKTWGSYQIITESFVAYIGLQIFAWLLLIGALVRALASGVRLIENIRKEGSERKDEKAFQPHQIFLAIGLGITIFMAGYLGSIAYSGSNIGVNVKDEYDYSWEPGSPLNYNDDKLNITVKFDLHNYGFFTISDMMINVDIYTRGTTNLFPTLEENTKIGEVDEATYDNFPAKQTTYNEELIVNVDSEYIPGLIVNDANLSLQIHFSCYYAGIFIDFYTNQTSYWEALI